jgi:REP element-mobilizing transposase RayT
MHIHADFGRLGSAQEFQIVQDSIFYVHRKMCLIYAYVVMPDHAHLALQPRPKIYAPSLGNDYREYYRVESILGSIKKYTARRINQINGRTGHSLWQDESYDRTVRSDKDLDGLIDYIHGNPVRWRLVSRPDEYPWSSASTIYSGRDEYREWFEVD